jgi:hypothetical protein
LGEPGLDLGQSAQEPGKQAVGCLFQAIAPSLLFEGALLRQ